MPLRIEKIGVLVLVMSMPPLAVVAATPVPTFAALVPSTLVVRSTTMLPLPLVAAMPPPAAPPPPSSVALVALTAMLPLPDVAPTLGPLPPDAVLVPPVMFTVLVPLVVVVAIAAPVMAVTLLAVVTVTLPPPAVAAVMAPAALTFPPDTVPVGVTKMLALLAALVIWATMPANGVETRLPLGLMVMSPLVLVALLVTLMAGPPRLEMMLPKPPTLMLPVLLELALTPPDAPVAVIPPLSVIEVLPVPPTMPETMPMPATVLMAPA